MGKYWLPETIIHIDGTVFVVINEHWVDENDIPMESPRKKYSTDGDLWVLPINFEPICIKN
jgi:hypothetical protein